VGEINNKAEIKDFHTLSGQDVIEYFNSDIDGITDEEAAGRIKIYGKNEIAEGRKKNLLEKFIEQLRNVMIIVLLAAAAISCFMREYTDTVIILVVVVINAVLGIIQENKAERSLEALKKMSSPHVKVRRGGEVKQIKTGYVVPGDIVLLEAGDYIPADMRLINVSSLKVEEASITGESVPAEKTSAILDKPDLVIGDRLNTVYSGSSVVYGRGEGIVTAIGMNTEVGKIARHISITEKQDTPLQVKLAEMSKYLTVGVILILIIIFLAGVFQGRTFYDMFLIAVSLAVAAIPEGLPAVVTIVLAMGVQKMAVRNAIIRKLSAVETLGGAEIICTDKTGTLTQNKMTVKEVFLDNNLKSVDELSEIYNSRTIFLQSIILCNDTKITRTDEGNYRLIGDPTETALVELAESKGFQKESTEQTMPRAAEIPFDSDRKLMTTINKVNGTYRIITKGAPDVLLEKCTGILINGEIKDLSEGQADSITAANKKMAGRALRVLSVAIRDIEAIPQSLAPEDNEKDLVYLRSIRSEL